MDQTKAKGVERSAAPEGLITQRELARHWRMSEATLERWRSVGLGPHYVKIGIQVRYHWRDVRAYEEGHRFQSTAKRVAPQ